MQGCQAEKVQTPRRKSRRALRRQLIKIGAVTPNPPRPKWTPEQIGALVEMRGRGMNAEAIFKSGDLPHSLNAIQKKLGRMGLVQHLSILKFNAQQREELREFLRRNWEGETPQDLTDLWNESRPRLKINKRRVVSYLTDLGIKIHYGEVQRMNCARRKEMELASSGANLKDISDRIKAHRADLMRRRIELGRDIWTGLPLPQGRLDECELLGRQID